MTHEYVQLDQETGISSCIIQHKEYNLDKKDTLSDLPALPAVYAICGRVNGQAVNARFVGATENLQAAVAAHYTAVEKDENLRNFMQSIKIKTLVYIPMPESADADRQKLKQEWETRLNPRCTEALNQVY